MSNRAIAHRLGVSENAIRKLVGPSKRESAQLALAAITPAVEKPATNAAPSATPSVEDGDHASRSAEEHSGDRDPITAPEAANDDEPVPMSLDSDADNRTFDRQLAHLGLLDDAAPLFREGFSVPGVGVLLALPCLVESGLFRISRKLFGGIGPAFYGLRTTLLTLLLFGEVLVGFNTPFATDISKPTGSEWKTSSPDEIRRFQSDPLCGKPFSNAMTYSVFKGFHSLWLQENESRIPRNLPILIVAGADDPVGCKTTTIQSLITRNMSQGQLELAYRFYLGGRHEILNESEKDQVHRDIAHWLTHVLDR